MKPQFIHQSITDDRVIEAVSSDSQGGCCIVCGAEDPGPMEPDAPKAYCKECDRPYLYPWEEILIRGYYHESQEA